MLTTAIGFQPQFLDFERGIRVGNLEDHERITRILKLALEARYGGPFVTERWGRGVYWQWIGYLLRANREAKPLSSRVSFGCAKYFIMIDRDTRLFECGMQVERGYVKAPPERQDCRLAPDWDWNRLLKSLAAGGAMEPALRRLLGEGFLVHAGGWGEPEPISQSNFPGAAKLRRILQAAQKDCWAGFQVFYPMREAEVRSSSGLDLVESMLAVFDEVTPLMNLCMQVPLERRI